MSGTVLAEKGTAAWLDRMRLLLPVKLSARTTVQGHYLNSRCHRMALLLWVLWWLLISLWILSSMTSQAMEMRREALADMCEERARMLDDKVKATMNNLQALGILVSTFHHSKTPSAIDQTTFARYLDRTAFERPRMSGLAYAARVRHAERELFERQQARPIKLMNFSKQSQAEEYAPIMFTQEQGIENIVLSLDMLQFHDDRKYILRSRESGKVILTAPFKLLDNSIGVVLIYAVYKSELPSNATVQERIHSAIGYLGCAFDIEAHVDELLQKLAGKQSIVVNVYDTTSEKPISMYGTNDTGSGMCHVSMLNFGDPSRKHEMHCRFTQRQPWPWLAITSSYGTLVVSLLVGYIIHITGKQIAKVEGADTIHATHEPCQREQLYKEDALLEPEQATHESEPEQEVEELNLHQEVQDKLNETETNLVALGTRSKFITKFKELASLSSRFHYMNKKVVSVSLLGLVLYFIVIGAFDRPSLNQSLGMSRGDDNMMLKNFGRSRRRLLTTTLHDEWAKRGVQGTDMISVDLRKMIGNNHTSGQQKHWSSHNLPEIPAILYILRDGKQVMIHCNLIADEKALAKWISNGNTDLSSRLQEESTQIQNRTARLHLPAHKSHITTVGLWIALFSAILLLLGIAVWILFSCKRRTRVQQNEMELLAGMGPRGFQLHELAAATSNFAVENKLGQGGFGPVYRGYLRDQDLHVAIKVLSEKQSSQQQSEQGLKEFKAEVKVLTQLRHRNIVKLVGWCDSKKRLLLVYELMAQGSLDKHLYDPEKVLTWQQRFKIVLDLGSGLLYLHRDCEKCIVHGDIKPANVMLDVSHNAKLGDFGLARLVEHGGEPQTTQVVAGTPGYIDPEFINNRWPRTELDVYSFGVVLLEIACGKRPASRQPNGASSLLAWVHNLYDQGMVLDAADERLNGQFDEQQMERVIVTGLWCAHQDPIQRLSIVQAMDVLRYADAELPVIPAVHDARHIRSMEEQAYADLPVEDRSVHSVFTPSTYFTSKDSVYLLAEE